MKLIMENWEKFLESEVGRATDLQGEESAEMGPDNWKGVIDDKIGGAIRKVQDELRRLIGDALGEAEPASGMYPPGDLPHSEQVPYEDAMDHLENKIQKLFSVANPDDDEASEEEPAVATPTASLKK